MLVRLNKYLADKGICSRREADKLIDEKAVKVNGKLVEEQGVKVDPEKDVVEVSEIALDKKAKEIVVYALNKPVGYVCSTHKTSVEKDIILDLFSEEITAKHIYSVGRLDKDTSGLLIVTNDGDLAYELTHPKFEHSKKYFVETNVPIHDSAVDKLKKGVTLFGQKTLPAEVERLSRTKILITIREGKNRQIRRICRKVGAHVKRLKRVQIGALSLEDLGLNTGEYKLLTKAEISKLKVKS